MQLFTTVVKTLARALIAVIIAKVADGIIYAPKKGEPFGDPDADAPVDLPAKTT